MDDRNPFGIQHYPFSNENIVRAHNPLRDAYPTPDGGAPKSFLFPLRALHTNTAAIPSLVRRP